MSFEGECLGEAACTGHHRDQPVNNKNGSMRKMEINGQNRESGVQI